MRLGQDILDISTGAWARVLPSGDPGPQATNKPAFPSPREGAVAFSYSRKLVGSNRDAASDTIVFGGRDASGTYLREIWLLRAYNDSLTQSGQKWTGFGNGKLSGGPDPDGAGVTVQYMTACAKALGPTPTSGNSPTGTGSGSGPTGSSTGDQTSSGSQIDLYDTSVVHKILAPVSVAIGLPAILLFRVSGFSMSQPDVPGPGLGLFYASIVIAIAAFGVGVGGLASSFTSIAFNNDSSTTIAKRAVSSSSLHLQTGHGRAGLALFAALYGLVPILMLISMGIKLRRNGGISTLSLSNGRSRYSSSEAPPEKRVDSPTGAASEVTSVTDERPHSRGRRHRSWSSFGVWPGSRTSGRMSEESVSREVTSPSGRSFEVTNRPQRQYHASVHSLAPFAADNRPGPTTRSVSEGGWFERRRSLTSPVSSSDFEDQNMFCH